VQPKGEVVRPGRDGRLQTCQHGVVHQDLLEMSPATLGAPGGLVGETTIPGDDPG
jgi:hypothetical protein